MHVLILHNSHSTTDWGSAQHSVSEGRKLKHNKHMASDLGNLQCRSRGFSAFLKKTTTALCWHNRPAELCSPVLQALWVRGCSVLLHGMSWMCEPRAEGRMLLRTGISGVRGDWGPQGQQHPEVTTAHTPWDVTWGWSKDQPAAVLWAPSPESEMPLVCPSWPSVLHPQLNRYKRWPQ